MRAILLVLLLASISARACMNMIERVPGVSFEEVEVYELVDIDVDKDSLHGYIQHMSARCAKGLDRKCSDLVVAYLYDKEFKTGLALSTRLVAKFPDDYSVVITHAAALELNGRAAEAIPFMRHALELDPKSHHGSEWIHLKILEQRVSGGTPTPQSLIAVDLRSSGKIAAPDTIDVGQLLRQVHYQLNDRLYFTPDDDPLFGALLFAYADLLELNRYHSIAKEMRELADDYGFELDVQEKAPAPSSKTPEANTATGKAEAPQSTLFNASMLAWLFVGLLVVCAFAFVWRNRRAEG